MPQAEEAEGKGFELWTRLTPDNGSTGPPDRGGSLTNSRAEARARCAF
jgi:hypothetical protein